MRRLFTLIVVLLSLNADGQYMLLTNFTGTATYGSRTCTVVGAGSATTYTDPCLGPPTLYWVGSGGPGTYTYTFSAPVYTIWIKCDYLNNGTYGLGEYLKMTVNGAFYPLTPANMISYNVCGLTGPSYLYTGWLMGPNSSAFDYNGGEFTISMCTGITSFSVYCNGIAGGVTWHCGFDSTRPPICVHAINNGPCRYDTLKLDMIGDSTGATYSWTGPGTFTSTLQDPFILGADYPDTGVYRCIRTVGASLDTSYTDVVIHLKPIVTASSNAPLCAGLIDTLKLDVLPDSTGETFAWTGPNSFVSTLQMPTIPGFTAGDTGLYRVIAKTIWGCIDTGYTEVGIVPPPPAPMISGVTSYCQGSPFVPFTVTGYTGTLLWYTTGTGGVGRTTPLGVSTIVPGLYKVWVSQVIGSCESPRDSIAVRVITTPLAPPVAGTMQYCQFIGPYVPLHVTTTLTGIPLWYMSATGGTSTGTEPPVNVNVAGTYNSWVSQIDSSCESPRTPVTIVVHPKPNPPAITLQGPYCQFQAGVPLVATPSLAGDFLTWFGAGIPSSGTLLTPIPQTNVAMLDSYYVNETTVYGCISDKALDTVRVLPKPQPPVTRDTNYCQFAQSVYLNYETDSAGHGGGCHLNWYTSATLIPTPLPSTAVPGNQTWYVSQTINNCQSDSAAITVTTIYLPKFAITPSSPWVCQFDSITLAYRGPSLVNSAFLWTIPVGDSFATGSVKTDSMIMVKFDSGSQNAYAYLKASDDFGKCFTIDTISIKVVTQPTASSYTKADVCLGDTTSLDIAVKSMDANNYQWYIDYITLIENSSALNIISSGSNSGGPFSISWLDTGRHVIKLNSFTEEGCASKPSFDTVNVHAQPDASFDFTYNYATLCLEDSIYFTANSFNYNNSYVWSPAHSFTNLDKPTAWGKLEQNQSVITLTVTNPFGCVATTSKELEPGSCCTVNFPNAFTPNGDGHDDYFRPLYTGYHNFHEFRVVNRWGQSVFESTNSNLKWDGTFNGVPQDMGVYFYYIKYDCGGRTLELSGDVTLIR